MLVAVLLGTTAAGCSRNPAPTVVRGSTLTLRVSAYAIRPQVARVRSGPLALVVRDVGPLADDVHVLGSADDPRGPSFDYGGTPGAHPGDTVRSATRLLLAPGRYQIVDTVSNHATLGATGTLIVTP
jgi:hypothetical protein